MHLTYNAIQTGWQHDPGRAGWLARSAHTQPFFEYTAYLVNSLDANRGLAGGAEVHHVRLGRRIERYEGGQPDKHQRIVIKS